MCKVNRGVQYVRTHHSIRYCRWSDWISQPYRRAIARRINDAAVIFGERAIPLPKLFHHLPECSSMSEEFEG
jgi:hypothetical protein